MISTAFLACGSVFSQTNAPTSQEIIAWKQWLAQHKIYNGSIDAIQSPDFLKIVSDTIGARSSADIDWAMWRKTINSTQAAIAIFPGAHKAAELRINAAKNPEKWGLTNKTFVDSVAHVSGFKKVVKPAVAIAFFLRGAIESPLPKFAVGKKRYDSALLVNPILDLAMLVMWDEGASTPLRAVIVPGEIIRGKSVESPYPAWVSRRGEITLGKLLTDSVVVSTKALQENPDAFPLLYPSYSSSFGETVEQRLAFAITALDNGRVRCGEQLDNGAAALAKEKAFASSKYEGIGGYSGADGTIRIYGDYEQPQNLMVLQTGPKNCSFHWSKVSISVSL